ncbi:MAG: hypothetical protein JO265_03805 [Acidimicrobiia bacterium]|nr:hypothetical protein [Acidimicrobiia bacterium]
MLLVVLGTKFVRTQRESLEDVLAAVIDKRVTVGVATSEEGAVMPIGGYVKEVRDGALYLDSPEVDLNVPPERQRKAGRLLGPLLGPIRPEDGILLERIRWVQGPADSHWP